MITELVRDLFGRKSGLERVESVSLEKKAGYDPEGRVEANGRLTLEQSPTVQDLVLPLPEKADVVRDEGDDFQKPSPLEVIPASPSPSPVKSGGLDFGKALEGLTSGDSGSAVAGIREVGKAEEDGKNLPMIADIRNPIAFTACQIHKAYCEELGYSTRAWVYDKALKFAYMHSVAVHGKNGNRVDKMLAAYKIEFQKEFEIKKHSKAESALGS